MRKNLIAAGLLLLALLGAGTALAQVAAPSLSPGFIADNPAVIQWSPSSNVCVFYDQS
ncbi:MAG: hypothetical protein O7A69_11910 [SAR324 cluster bacterium]|nr:hypothetical protein [SAR324 cluster bacterium]